VDCAKPSIYLGLHAQTTKAAADHRRIQGLKGDIAGILDDPGDLMARAVDLHSDWIVAAIGANEAARHTRA